MEAAQVLAARVPQNVIFETEQVPALQPDAGSGSAAQSGNDLHNVVVDDVTVRVLQQVENCPQIARLRTEINLDVHRALDPDFVWREKKEIF